MKKKLGARIWSVLILVGLSGQFAWTLENMYFNVFLYNTISTNTDYIAAMVAASAITATLTTLIMGALSDRVGKRKAFITAGYILWGITTAAFGFVTPESAGKVFPVANAAAAAAVLVIVLDCLMTFFGSTANDAAFNAYVTDNVPNDKRGKTEGVLAILPLVSMLVVFGLFDGFTKRGEWKTFFSIFGIMVTVVGIISLFIVKDSPALKPRKDSYFKNLLYGLRPSVVKSLPGLYWALLALCIFFHCSSGFLPLSDNLYSDLSGNYRLRDSFGCCFADSLHCFCGNRRHCRQGGQASLPSACGHFDAGGSCGNVLCKKDAGCNHLRLHNDERLYDAFRNPQRNSPRPYP